jgi:hypothetical protein
MPAYKPLSLPKQLILGFVFCVFLPGFFTAIAPVTYVNLQRQSGQVHAETRTCFFFVIPFKSQRLESVIGVGKHYVFGKSTRPHKGQSDRYHSDDEGFLDLHSETETIQVAVSPVNVKDKLQQVQDYLQADTADSLSFAVIANWKVGAIAGGTLSLLTLVYCYGVIRLIVKWFVKR